MTVGESGEILQRLQVDMNSSSMMIFRAVLMAAGGTSKPVTYAAISEALKKSVHKKYTKAYVYSQLNSLEEEGFISIDTVQHPKQYMIVESSVADALKRRSQRAISELICKRERITAKLDLLEKAAPQDIAITAYNDLVGISSQGGSIMIEGIENVRSMVIREFADSAKPGDSIRVLASAGTLAEGLGPGGITELRIIQSGFRGVKVRALLIPVEQTELTMSLIAGHLRTLSGDFVQGVSTGNIELRLAGERLQTYRMVSLNSEKILLYLTQAKASDIAALIHRKDNPVLVDDAIETFDRLWNTGFDIIAPITQKVSSQ